MTKFKFEIKNWAGVVLFTYESDKEATVREATEAAVKQGAYLEGANLEGAYLRGANLEGANLRGAYLEGAYLRGAYLRGAKGVTQQVLQILGTRHAVIVRSYGELTIGCHTHKLSWWKKNYEMIGKDEGYTEEQIAEYADHIASAEKFMERYKLLKKPKAEEVGV